MMNRRFALGLVTAGAAAAAPDDAPLEPDDIGAVFRLRAGKLEPFESRRARWAKRHQKMFTERDLLQVEGVASAVRYRRGEPLEFVVRCLMQARGFERLPVPPSLWRDPLEFELLRVDANPERGARELVLSERGFINASGSTGIFLYVRAWGDFSFLLRPGEPLTAGEYAIKYGGRHHDANELFCFGVDS
jgi:hypothetical protein